LLSESLDVLIVRQGSRSAKRIKTDENYAEVYSAIGSSENAQFARMARTRKVLYFEGNDNRIFSKISKSFGGIDCSNGSSVTIMKTDGFSNWRKVSNTAYVFKSFFELDVQVAALFDRDYRSDEEVGEFETDMFKAGAACYVLPFKEIENVLLVSSAIRAVVSKFCDSKIDDADLRTIDVRLEEFIQRTKDKVFSMQMAHFMEFRLAKLSRSDVPTLSSEFQKEFSYQWENPSYRRAVVPGKEIFSLLARSVQETWGVTLTAARVIEELGPADIDGRLLKIIAAMKDFFGPES
jgi:hypothetical protein